LDACRDAEEPFHCPTCVADLVSIPNDEMNKSVELRGVLVAVQSLQVSQPLAFIVLKQIQVACIDFTDHQCSWSGDYGDFLIHAERHGHEAGDNTFTHSDPVLETPVRQRIITARPTLAAFKSLSLPNILSPGATTSEDGNTFYDGELLDDDDEDDQVAIETPASSSRRSVFRKSQSARIGDEVDIEEPISLASLKSALALPQWIENESIHTDPVSQKPPPSALPSRDSAPNQVQRKKSDDRDGNAKNSVGKRADRPSRRKDCVPDENEGSSSQTGDWNTSINSLGGWNSSFNDTHPDNHASSKVEGMETVEEAHQGDAELERSDDELDLPVENILELLEMAEKLRKQANAKFNKGDFQASRLLYTEGIEVLGPITPKTRDEIELVANLYSNRAVTFFREKRFENCVEDCDNAIQYDASYDKSWIRKWRALMALGNFDVAHECLEKAALAVRNPTRVQGELVKARQEKQLITHIRGLLASGEYAEAKEILKPHAMSSDNIGLLFLAARADCGLGRTESALEKVDKALRFNPTHVEGLELRGYAMFLSGDTEKGAHLLQEASNRDTENNKLRSKLMRCQATHSACSKGRSEVKRGRYKEAVDHFTLAMSESGEVPNRATLFGALRTERAEALLLSKKYLDALKDCQDVIYANTENATAWAVRAEVLVATGNTDEAKNELDIIRRTWGSDNPTIDEAYKRVDFELRVQKADEELQQLAEKLQAGTFERLTSNENGKSHSELRVPERRGVSSRKSDRSQRNDRNPESRAKQQENTRREIHRKPSTDSTGMERRAHSRSRRNRRSTSRARRRNSDEDETSSVPDTTAPLPLAPLAPAAPARTKSAKKSSFVPPPSVEDILASEAEAPQRSFDRKSRRSSVKRQ